jgi:hypothetical protein
MLYRSCTFSGEVFQACGCSVSLSSSFLDQEVFVDFGAVRTMAILMFKKYLVIRSLTAANSALNLNMALCGHDVLIVR